MSAVANSSADTFDLRRNSHSRQSCPPSLLASGLLSLPGGRQRASLSRLAASPAEAVDAWTAGPGEDDKPATLAAAGRGRLRGTRHAVGRVAGRAVAAVRRAATPSRRRRAAGVALVSAAAFCFLGRPAIAAAIGGAAARRGRALVGMIPSSVGAGAGVAAGAAEEITLESVAPKLALWFTLFVTSAAFHSAEIAITTLYPWKVKEFAEEEGSDSPFQVLVI